MTRFKSMILPIIALPLLLALQTASDPIEVVSERGPGTIPVTDIDGTSMIPLRGVASFAGATVRPGSESGAATISANGTIARVSDGRNFVPVEGRLVLLQSPAKLVGDEWYVPLDFLTKVLPTLSSESVLFRERERMLVLGSNFPRIEIHSRPDPTFTRVTIEPDREVPMSFEQSDDAIRVRIDAPYVNTDFRGEDVRDDVIEHITLDRDGEGYLVTVHLGNRFGTLRTNGARQPDDALVLDLVRSRVPRRAERGVDEVQWDLAEQTDEEEVVDPEATDPESEEGDEPNPNAEVIELPEDTHHLPGQSLPPAGAGPGLELGRPGGPARLRIVTLDPGHGGTETGALGQDGSVEKDVVLSVARRFRSLLQSRLGVQVILTRDGDRTLSLDERAAIANSNKSDLFVSIHADASPRRNARGSSVYFLSYDSSSPQSAESTPSSGSGLDFILWDMAQASHLSQSSRLAEILQEELQSTTGSRRVNRGIKQNTFRVLRGATMPAVLVELGFISNPDEEKLLNRSDYQDKLAEALYRGLLRYKDLFENGSSAGGSAGRAQRSQR